LIAFLNDSARGYAISLRICKLLGKTL